MILMDKILKFSEPKHPAVKELAVAFSLKESYSGSSVSLGTVLQSLF